LYNHFGTTFVQLSLSYSHYVFILSLPFSLLFLTNEKREQQGCLKGCTKIVVQISLLQKLNGSIPCLVSFYNKNDEVELHKFLCINFQLRMLIRHLNVKMFTSFMLPMLSRRTIIYSTTLCFTG
jgi:hypothetical protein